MKQSWGVHSLSNQLIEHNGISSSEQMDILLAYRSYKAARAFWRKANLFMYPFNWILITLYFLIEVHRSERKSENLNES